MTVELSEYGVRRKLAEQHAVELLSMALAMVDALEDAFGIDASHDDDYAYDALPSSDIALAYFRALAVIRKTNGDRHDQ